MRWLDGITHWMNETGLILRCAGKAGNPFQTTQGNRVNFLMFKLGLEKVEEPDIMSLMGYSSWGHEESDTTEQPSTHAGVVL